jgi:predicted Zn-dependent protease with MMP-like domain
MRRLTDEQRQAFDELLEHVIAELPDELRELLEEVPLVVEDFPSASLLRDLGMDPAIDDLCGLHSGIALTNRSVEQSGTLPDQMMLFRGPIMSMVGVRNPRGKRSADLIEEIRITLLHEMGHHFGLDEEDLEQLGYG